MSIFDCTCKSSLPAETGLTGSDSGTPRPSTDYVFHMKLMPRFVFVAAVYLTFLLAAAGCSDLNGTRLEPVLGGDVNLVKLGDKVAQALIKKTLPPLTPRQSDQAILVSTPVNNDNLDDTSSFGRSLQNNIAAGFVSRGYAVKEIKLRKEMLIEAHKGEFMLTRDLRDLASKQQAQAIVVGTYTLVNRVMYISIRLVSPVNQNIQAVYEDKLYLDENSLRMLGLKFKEGEGCESSAEICPPSPSILDKILY